MSSRTINTEDIYLAGSQRMVENDFTMRAGESNGKSKLCTCMPLYQISCDYSSTNALQVVFWIEAKLLPGFLSLKKIS